MSHQQNRRPLNSRRPDYQSTSDSESNTNTNSNNNNVNSSSSSSTMSHRTRGPNAELSDQISQLTKWNTKLERLLAKVGSSADTPEFRDKMHSEQTEATELVKNIMGLMKEVSRDPTMDKSLVQRLSNNFKREFQNFQRLQEQLDKKQTEILNQAANAGSLSDNRNNNQRNNNQRYDPYSQSNNNNGSSDFQTSSNQLGEQLLSAEQFQFLEFNAEEIERRTVEIHQIESQIVEVAEMFQDLQSLVYQQQEHIDIIDNNIVEAKEKTEMAGKELLEAEEYQAKARRRKCCIISILLGIVGVIVLLVYVAK